MRRTLLVLAACGSSKGVDQDKAAQLYTEVVVDTAPGLSGLAVDDDGAIWTVAERDDKAYLINLDPALKPTIQTFTITGIPDGTDLEGMAWLSKGHHAFGTEGRDDGVATVLLGEERGTKIEITGSIAIPEAKLGLHLEANHGTEGICGVGNTIIAGIEEVGSADGKRWAPIVRIERGEVTEVHKLWLTTKTGKISGLDCQLGTDGSIHAIAIERHFEVTKILTFTMPASATADITPHEALDLGPVFNGKVNLEGIALLRDGSVVAVNDNQYKTIDGPSRLFVFKPGVVK